MGIAEFIIGPAVGRTRWFDPGYALCSRLIMSARLLSRDGNSQECRGNRGGILVWAFVLAVEQDL
jgi:hypothetical protein